MYSGCGIRRYLCLIFAILLVTQGVDLLKCKCSKGRECFRNGTCETEGVCFTLIYFKHSAVTTDYGCFHPDILYPVGNPMVCHSNELKAHRESRRCCKSRDYCNAEHVNHPTLAPLPSVTLSQENKILIGIIVFAAVLFCSLLVVIICWHRSRRVKLLKNESDVHLIPSTPTETKIDISFSENSGSGSGLPLFMPITIARQISLDTIVGTGRYGEVWRGIWRGDFVAVKIFHSREERSWSREAQIYQTVMLRHENILGFIAADNKDNGTWTQLWLVTDYYPHGSLFDYLNSTVINMEVMLQMLLSIANGLAHLHMEIIGTQGKPGIAHRDLKSKNILVKNNLQCCIADLGLAVKHDSELDKVDIASNNRVGTVRYMAPEIIQDLIDPDKFVGFKQADIYSLALVFWEILRRCDHFGPPEEYQLPYYDCVPSDPTHEEMLKAVVTDEKRPTIPREWTGNKTYEGVINVMCECWSGYPSVRVEALRIKKSLVKIIDNYNVMLQPTA